MSGHDQIFILAECNPQFPARNTGNHHATLKPAAVILVPLQANVNLEAEQRSPEYAFPLADGKPSTEHVRDGIHKLLLSSTHR